MQKYNSAITPNRILFALITVALLALSPGLLRPTATVHAQLSCDDPPFDVSSLQSSWDKTDFCNYEDGVFEEILRGCFGRDCIPAIHDPSFDSIETASEWLEPQSPVIALDFEGEARAYPLAILTRHEIVNDEVNGTPLAVTFCPLCNSALVFNREIEGEVVSFGVSGLLRNSDLVMYDDLTQTWWQQLTGTGLVGTYTGYELEFVPSTLVGFGVFAENFPDGTVLSPDGRNYGSNPYENYDSSSRPFLFAGTPDERLHPTERVLAIEIDDEAIAYPFKTLFEENVINDVVGDRPVVAFWQPGATSALDKGDIDASKDVGMAALYRRTVDDNELTFYMDEDGNIRDEQTESAWNVFGLATEGEMEGTQLRQELAAPHFWFAWAAFKPDTAIYGIDEAETE